jgi:hypothetical protein
MRTPDTKEELEYFKLLYNFEDTLTFFKERKVVLKDAKRDIFYWLKETNRLLGDKNHSHHQYLVILKNKMEQFLNKYK